MYRIHKYPFLFFIYFFVTLLVSLLNIGSETSGASSSNSVIAFDSLPLERKFQEVKPYLLDHAFKGILSEIKECPPANSTRCFISYVREIEAHTDLIDQIAKDLKAAGAHIYDLWDTSPGTSISRFTENIRRSDKVILFGSQKLMENYGSLGEGTINAEIEQIFGELIREEGKVIPILLDGTISTSFPPFIRGVVNIDFKDPTLYFENACKLLRRVCSQKEEQILPLIEKFMKVKAALENCRSPTLMAKAVNRYEKRQEEEGETNKILMNSLIDSCFEIKPNPPLMNASQEEIVEYPRYLEERLWVSVSSKEPVHNIILQDIKFFESIPMGARESYLLQLWKALNLYPSHSAHRCSTIIINPSKCLPRVIAGMGGIGKTQLALEYADLARRHKAYELIGWIHSETKESISRDYQSILRKLKVMLSDQRPDEIIDLFKTEINQTKKKWLLIYDNVESSALFKQVTPISEKGHIIVTSRKGDGEEWGDNIQVMPLEVFSPEESVRYLLERTGIEDTPGNKDSATQTASILGYLPLALSYASSYIITEISLGSPCSFSSYLEEFQISIRDLLDHHPRDPEGKIKTLIHQLLEASSEAERNEIYQELYKHSTYPFTIATTWALDRKRISNLADPRLSELSCDILSMMYYLEPDHILLDFFKLGFDEYDERTVKRSIKILLSYSLIAKRSDQYFSIHRILQLVGRTELERPEQNNKRQLLFEKKLYSCFLNGFKYVRDFFEFDLGCEVEGQIRALEIDTLVPFFKHTANFSFQIEKVIQYFNEFYPKNYSSEDLEIKIIYQILKSYFEKACSRIFNLIIWKNNDKFERTLESDIDTSRIIQIKFNVSSEEYDKIQEEAGRILDPHGRNGEEYQEIMGAITKLSKNQRGNILSNTNILITDQTKGWERVLLIETIASIPLPLRDKLIESMNPLLEKGLQGWQLARILDALSRIKIELIDEFIDVVKSFVAYQSSKEYIERLIDILAEIMELKSFLKVIELFTEETNSENYLIHLAEVISKNRFYLQADEVLRCLKTTLSENISDKNYLPAIEIFSEIFLRQESPMVLINHARSLIRGKIIKGESFSRIIKALLSISEGQREEIIFKTKEIIGEKEINEDDYAWTLIEISELNKEQYEKLHLIERTLKEMAYAEASESMFESLHKMNAADKLRIMITLLHLSLETMPEVLSIVSKCLPLWGPIKAEDLARIIEAVTKLEDSEQPHFLDSLQALSMREMNGDYIARIIESLAKVNDEQRRDILKIAQSLLTKKMYGWEYIRIIEVLSQIEPEHLKEIMPVAMTLMADTMNGENRAFIIKVVSQTNSTAERDDIFKWTRTLITDSMDGIARGRIFEYVAKIEGLHRDSILSLSKLFINDKMDVDNILRFLDVAAAIPLSEREQIFHIRRLDKILEKVETIMLEKKVAEVYRNTKDTFIDSLFFLRNPYSCLELRTFMLKNIYSFCHPEKEDFTLEDIENDLKSPVSISSRDILSLLQLPTGGLTKFLSKRGGLSIFSLSNEETILKGIEPYSSHKVQGVLQRSEMHNVWVMRSKILNAYLLREAAQLYNWKTFNMWRLMDLSESEQVDHEAIEVISQNCLNLNTLILCRMPNLKKIIFKPTSHNRDQALYWPSLEILNLEGTVKLERIYLNAINLKSLNLKDCRGLSNLEELILTLPSLSYINFENNSIEYMHNIPLGLLRDPSFPQVWVGAYQQDRKYQIKLGWMYANGKGVERDDVETVKWYQKSIENIEMASPQDQTIKYTTYNCLGWMTHDGRGGLIKDERKAMEFFAKAADGPVGRINHGCLNLGLMYEYGRAGLTRDYNKAASLYLKAANSPLPQNTFLIEFKYPLVKLMEKGFTPGSLNQQDFVKFLEPIKEAGYLHAYYLLDREGCLTSLTEDEIEYYTEQAKQGDGKAQVNLGFIYEYIEDNPREALRSYELSGSQGNPIGMYNYRSLQYSIPPIIEETEEGRISKPEVEREITGSFEGADLARTGLELALASSSNSPPEPS